MTDHGLEVVLIVAGTILAICLALIICAWVGSYTIHFTTAQLPTI